jgi:hypothetical protein
MTKRVLSAMVFGLAISMVAIFSLQAMAKTPKPKKFTGSLMITGSTGSLLTGECTTGYSDQCPSGNCECFTITGAKVAGGLGKGAADVFATLDLGDALADAPPTCTPVYGETLVTLKGQTETVNFQGAFCGALTVKGKASASGGWEIVDSTDSASGLGTVSGQGFIGGTDIDLTLKGSITLTP